MTRLAHLGEHGSRALRVTNEVWCSFLIRRSSSVAQAFV